MLHVDAAAPDILLRKRCENLNHPYAHWGRRIVSNGSAQLCYWCDTCVRPVTAEVYGVAGQTVSGEWLRERGIDPTELPEVRRDLLYRRCSRCGSTALCENHHIAMQSVFPDADAWPQVPLCRDCHDRWTTTYDAHIQRRIRDAITRDSKEPPAAE